MWAGWKSGCLSALALSWSRRNLARLLLQSEGALLGPVGRCVVGGREGGWSRRWWVPWAVLRLPGRGALALSRPGSLGWWWHLISLVEHLAGLVDECGGVSAKAGGPGRELPAEGGGGPVVPRGASPWEPRPVRSRVGGEGLVRCEVESGASHGGTWGGGALFGGSAGRSWGHWPPWA